MKNIKFTHIGYVTGCDSRICPEYRRKILLRETKYFWISKDGQRYCKKKFGRTPGDWPMYKIELDSIQPIEGLNDPEAAT